MGYIRFSSGGSDNFNRPDAPNLGPLWSQVGPLISVVSQQAAMPGAAASRAVQTGLGSLGNNVSCQARWRSSLYAGGVDGSGPACWKNDMLNGYCMKLFNFNGDVNVVTRMELLKGNAGVFFSLGLATLPDNPPFGPLNVQIFKIEVIPEGANNRIKTYRAGNILVMNVLDNGTVGGAVQRPLRGGIQDGANTRWDQFSWTVEGGIPVYGTQKFSFGGYA